jgi:hypothetical protein
MGRTIIITERQLALIQEHSFSQAMVEKLVRDLDMNYEPMIGVMREEGEYHEEPMVKIKADQTETSVKDLYEYFLKKYKLGESFTQQVIKDWMFGRIKDNMLSRNVPVK